MTNKRHDTLTRLLTEPNNQPPLTTFLLQSLTLAEKGPVAESTQERDKKEPFTDSLLIAGVIKVFNTLFKACFSIYLRLCVFVVMRLCSSIAIRSFHFHLDCLLMLSAHSLGSFSVSVLIRTISLSDISEMAALVSY